MRNAVGMRLTFAAGAIILVVQIAQRKKKAHGRIRIGI
jgi:hypothetical protein